MKRKIRLVSILVILIFTIELVATINFEQPYPAILFPSFANITNLAKPIKKPRIKIFSNNQGSFEIKASELFRTYLTSFASHSGKQSIIGCYN